MKNLGKEEQTISEILKNVIDPELMVNIIDLGLVYGIKLSEKEKKITIFLTLTSPGCPLGDVIIENIRQVLFQHYLGFTSEVTLVWNPMWNEKFISEEGRLALAQY